MSIVSGIVPEGYKEWSEKAKKIIAEHPEVFNTPEGGVAHDSGKHLKETKAGLHFVTTRVEQEVDDTREEWDGEEDSGGELEGTRSTEDRKGQSVIFMERPGEDTKQIHWEPEPALTADQYVFFLGSWQWLLTQHRISEMENKIGAGLIEEVIQVAEGELKLAGVMLKSKVYVNSLPTYTF